MHIICFSHLRWNFVYQRPQHLLQRASALFPVFFIEEPVLHDGAERLEITQAAEFVTVVVPFLQPGQSDQDVHRKTCTMLYQWDEGVSSSFIAWFYTPMAIGLLDAFPDPVMIVYDCMDELSAFRYADPEIGAREQRLMELADVVFTGGLSLYEAKKKQHSNIHVFPSSIDNNHFRKALDPDRLDPADQELIPHPRIGFFGVIDERFDISLIADLATAQPRWQIVLIGPVVKIDEGLLPRNANIHYLGSKSYEELPAYLGGWDVAIIPFLLNESTRFISPTKTPEYLSGGIPVVSTPIHDVVEPYGVKALVNIASTPNEFEAAIEGALRLKGKQDWQEKVNHFLKDLSWDKTWAGMLDKINSVLKDRRLQETKTNQETHV